MLNPDDRKAVIAARIREALDAYPGSQARLAEECGVKPQAITGWLKGKIGGQSAARLASLTGFNPAYLLAVVDEPAHSLSTEIPTGTAGAVHNPESGREIAPGYRRIGLLDAVASMGDGAEIVDFPEVVREMDFSEVQLRNLVGFLPPQGRLYLMTGRGTSMEPVIKPGDVVIVDVGHHYFDGDGVYVINSGRGIQIKALQDRGDGIWIVSANPTYPPFRAEEGMVIVGKVYVRNRFDRLD